MGFLGCERTESKVGAPEVQCVLRAWARGDSPVPGAAAQGSECGGQEGVEPGDRRGCGDPVDPRVLSHVCTAQLLLLLDRQPSMCALHGSSTLPWPHPCTAFAEERVPGRAHVRGRA